MDVKTTTQTVRSGSIGWMIKRVSARLDEEMNAQLQPHGLELTAFAILMTIYEHHPLSQAAIGARLDMPAYKVSRGLDALETLGLVARAADPASRRAHVIRPTDAGMALAPQMYGVVARVNAKLAAPLSEGEAAQFQEMLQRVTAAQALWREEG